jgi:hypothetical protein
MSEKGEREVEKTGSSPIYSERQKKVVMVKEPALSKKSPHPPFAIIAKWQVKRKNGVGEKLIGFMADNLQVLIDEMF